MTKKIRVLIVDDSAFARKVIREVLSSDPEIDVVGFARDGLEALERIAEVRPDVITLDLLMPDLDGLGLLRALPKENSPRVIVVSASASDSELALEALEQGAIDLITKPTPLPTDRLYELSSELVKKVKAAAIANPKPLIDPQLPSENLQTGTPSASLVVIGTSTGGPQALTTLFKSLPGNLPVPVAIALHIPAGYTGPLSARLTKLGGMVVVEAQDGAELLPGQAVIAPGGLHLKIKNRDGKFFALVTREPIDSIHHPSVDILFTSAAEAAGSGAVGLILTGMGNDGSQGARAIKEVGGKVLAESSSSCVVYGMPRVVIEAGTAVAEAPLQQLAALLVYQVFKK